jgi:hypothetical protein
MAFILPVTWMPMACATQPLRLAVPSAGCCASLMEASEWSSRQEQQDARRRQVRAESQKTLRRQAPQRTHEQVLID